MPPQQADSSFFQKYGQRIAQANAEHKDKPIDTGTMRLPPGINGGVCKLQVLEVRIQDKETGKVPKGERYLFAQALVLSPHEHNGRRTAGLHTFQYIPLCDIPAKGQRKAVSFNDNWFIYQNLFKLLSGGTIVCQETPQTDPTGQKAWMYYIAAAPSLTDPRRPGGPVLIEFSTRGWTPPATALQPNPEEIIFETWHGLASTAALNGQTAHNPSAGVTILESPPVMGADDLPIIGNMQGEGDDPDSDALTAEIAELVAIATDDPTGATDEGSAAMLRLQEMAWAAGWSKEQTKDAESWEQVGEMAKWGPLEDEEVNETSQVTVGSKWNFAKRDKNGAKLKTKEGQEFPAVAVEVVTVDEEKGTCTVKTVKDGKTVINVGTKKPLTVKFEWLE